MLPTIIVQAPANMDLEIKSSIFPRKMPLQGCWHISWQIITAFSIK